MQISFLIVTWNACDHIDRCLQSIQKNMGTFSYEVIVIDNASTDGTPEHITDTYPWVQLIANKHNVGFGKANNQGAAVASGEYLFLLNDDTELTAESVRTLYTNAHNDSSIGVLGPHLVFPDRTHQDSVRRDPHLFDQMIIVTKIHNFFPSIIARYLAQEIDYTRNQAVEQLMGAALFMPKKVFEEVGGFDPRFFLWFEEVDLIKRIRETMQKKVYYVSDATVIHQKGTSFGKVASIRKQLLFQRSQRYYFYKHEGLIATILLTLIQPLGLFLAFIVAAITRLGGNIQKIQHGQN